MPEDPRKGQQPLTCSIERVIICIQQTHRRTQLDRILHIAHLLHRTIPIIQRLRQIHMRQHIHHGAVHAPQQRLVVRCRCIIDHRRATRPRQPSREGPKGGTDHDEFRRAPRHQGGILGARVPRHAFGVEVCGEAVSFLHAREARGRRHGSQAHGAVGGYGHRVAGGYLAEQSHDGRLVGGGFEEGAVAVRGGGALFCVVDCAVEVLPHEGEEGLELGGFGVGLAGAAEEDLVGPARCCVVGSVVLEQEARGCGVGCEERSGGVCGVCADDALREGGVPDG